MNLPSGHAGFWWGLSAALFCIFVVWFPVTDADIWWHCAAGREIVARDAFLLTDPFSYTAAGLPWYDLHWIFQVSMFAACSVGGTAGLVCAKCLLFVSACAIAFFAIPGRRSWFISSAVFCLFVYGIRYQVTERPVLLSLVFLALFVFILERSMGMGRFRALALLVPLQILWVNSQGLFGLGIAVYAIYLTGDAIDAIAGLGRQTHGVHRWSWRATGLLVLGGVVLLLACLVNPYGWHSIAFGLKLFGAIEPVPGNVYSAAIAENMPLFGLIGTPEAPHFWIAVLAGLLTAFSFVIAGQRMRSAHLLIAVLFGALALMANRNVLLFVFTAAPILACNLSSASALGRLAERFPGPRGFRFLAVSARVMVAAVLGLYALSHALVLAQGPHGPSGQGTLAPFRFPERSVEYLKSHDIPGRLFNTDRFGGYLLWRLFPSEPVYIDGRFTLRGAEFLRDYCTLLEKPEENFAAIKDRYGITQACIQTSIFPIYDRLAAHLYHDPRWRLVVADGSEALFVVDSLAKTERLDLGSVEGVELSVRSLRARWSGSPALFRESLIHLASFLRTVGEEASADRVMGILQQEAVRG